MPVLTKKQETEVVVGMKCDVCGKVDENGFNDFVLRHTFGFDSAHDMESVEAAICDDCLYDLIKAHVPGAKFIS